MIHLVEHLRKENAELRRQLAEAGRFYNINEQWVRIDEKAPNFCNHTLGCCCLYKYGASPHCRE